MAVRDVGQNEHIEESAAMRKLLYLGIERYLAERYRAGEITLREMARRMGTSLSEALDLLQRLGIPGNVGAADALSPSSACLLRVPKSTRLREARRWAALSTP